MGNFKSSKVFFTIFLLFVFRVSFSQEEIGNKEYEYNPSDTTKKVRVAPGKQYEAGSTHEFFFGSHWRDLWGTEFDVEVLDMESFGGGLTATKKGGGLQTLSLRLMGEDGNEYKFRSINKAPTNSLPPELKNSIYGDIIQDQISIGMPVSNIVVPPLLNAVGVLNSEPIIVMLPDDSRLGEFRSQFGGLLGTIEINPRAGKKWKNSFADADKVITGYDIYIETEEDNDERVDQVEFLKARLMDIWLGDRDRHGDQWKWAGYKDEETGLRYWKPIPRDRDYAFGMYDGLFPWASGFFAHSLVGFNEDIPQITEITWTGRHLDRRFLGELDKRQWDSVATYISSQLTDDVIRDAVKMMPPEMYSKRGEELIAKLISRREQLAEATNEFYELFSNVVDVYGSEKREYMEVDRLDDKEVRIRVYKRDKDTGGKKGEPLFNRTFDSDYTSEIRIHLLGGKDKVLLTGKVDDSIPVRIVGGKGKSEVIDNSKVEGNFLGIIPIPDAKTMTKVYKSSKKMKVDEGPSTSVIYEKVETSKDPMKRFEPFEPSIDDRYNFWAFTPVLNANSDDGYILGGGPNYTQHGFRAAPYLYYLQLTGAYATTSKDYDFNFYGDFTKLIRNANTKLFAEVSELDFNRFYGVGNESVRNEQLAGEKYYVTERNLISFAPVVSVNVAENFQWNFAPAYEYSNVETQGDENEGNIIGDTRPYGTGDFSLLKLATGFTYDSRDRLLAPENGIYFSGLGAYYPAVFNNPNDFSSIEGDARAYLTAKTFTDVTLALRVGGKKVFGTYPFYKSASIGGSANLRGYPKNRYSGDASVYSSAELRMYVMTLHLFFPARTGITLFTDAGRVFVGGESSDKWHSAYGGGVWLNILDGIGLNFAVGRSPDATRYYFSSGFTF